MIFHHHIFIFSRFALAVTLVPDEEIHCRKSRHFVNHNIFLHRLVGARVRTTYTLWRLLLLNLQSIFIVRRYTHTQVFSSQT
jgi:hypothetical protein